MKNTIIRSTLASLTLVAMLFTATAQPARADGAATTRLLAGVAAAAAIFTAVNVQHKQALANTVQGYLPDGSPVYADGHVVTPNGQTWYPGNQGQSVACNNGRCTITGTASNGGYANGGYYNGGYYNDNDNSGWHRHHR